MLNAIRLSVVAYKKDRIDLTRQKLRSKKEKKSKEKKVSFKTFQEERYFNRDKTDLIITLTHS